MFGEEEVIYKTKRGMKARVISAESVLIQLNMIELEKY